MAELGTVRILLVHDDALARQAIGKLLCSAGYEVLEVENRAQALTLAGERVPHLVLVHSGLPQFEAFRFCQEWQQQKRLRHVPLVFLGRNEADAQAEAHAVFLGASGFWESSLGQQEFLLKVAEVLATEHAAFFEEKLQNSSDPAIQPEDRVAKLQTRIEELEAQNRRFTELLKARQWGCESCVSVIELDCEGRVVGLNPAAEWLTGSFVSEVRGKPVQELLPLPSTPDSWQWDEVVARVLRENSTILFPRDFTLLARDGTPRLVAGTVAPRVGEDRSPQGVLLFLWDQTALSPRGQRSSEFRGLADSVLDSMKSGLLILTSELRIARANHAFCQIFGVELEEIVGRTVWDLPGELFRQEQVRMFLQNALEKRVEVNNVPVSSPLEDGSLRVFELTIRVFKAEGFRAGVLILLQDVTVERQLEHECRTSAEALVRVAEAAPLIFWACDEHGVIQTSLGGGLKALGFQPGELVGKRLEPLLVGEAEADRVLTAFRQGLSGITQSLEVHYRGQFYHSQIFPNRDASGKVVGVWGVSLDLTQHRTLETALRIAEQNFRALFELLPCGAVRLDPEARILDCSSTMVEMMGQSREALVGARFEEQLSPESRATLRAAWAEPGNRSGFATELELVRADGSKRDALFRAKTLCSADNQPESVLGVLIDITEGKRQQRLLEALAGVGKAIAETRDLEALLSKLLRAALQAVPAASKGSILLKGEDGLLRVAATEGYADPRVQQLEFSEGQGYSWRVASEGVGVRIDDVRADPDTRYEGELDEVLAVRSAIAAPLSARDRVIGVLSLDSEQPAAFAAADLDALVTFAGTAALVIERRQLVEETARRLHRLELVSAVSAALRVATSRDEMLPILLDQVMDLLEAGGGVLALRNPQTGEIKIEVARGSWVSWLGNRLRAGEGIAGHVIENGRGFVSDDVRRDPRVVDPERLGDAVATVCVPLREQDHPIGAIWIGRRQPFGRGEVAALEAVAELAGNALQRAALHESTVQNARRLRALQEIDRAISSTAGVELILDSVCRQARLELHADACGVLLLDETNLLLYPRAAVGFQSSDYMKRAVRLGEDLPGQVALERRPLIVPDLGATFAGFPRAAMASFEGCSVYAAAPLLTKGAVQGVLELFWRTAPRFGPEERDFFERLALQCAIGVENALLFERLQRSNVELVLAYDATIEGWARALEIRDEETEGHTRRVTELTVALAREAGLSGRELVHVRRGALLHDIGKMAIPDTILFKAGPLTEEEWAIMRQHPVIAHQLLSSIPFLRPALDIPYCHHEKWDGSGYPRGLKGDAIPLPARLFAVVDVWDALSSRRPYRDPWPQERVRAYLLEESGRHFEPRAVELFLELLAKHPSGASWH